MAAILASAYTVVIGVTLGLDMMSANVTVIVKCQIQRLLRWSEQVAYRSKDTVGCDADVGLFPTVTEDKTLWPHIAEQPVAVKAAWADLD